MEYLKNIDQKYGNIYLNSTLTIQRLGEKMIN